MTDRTNSCHLSKLSFPNACSKSHIFHVEIIGVDNCLLYMMLWSAQLKGVFIGEDAVDWNTNVDVGSHGLRFSQAANAILRKREPILGTWVHRRKSSRSTVQLLLLLLKSL